MNEIIIGFSRPNGWFEPFSWLIRLMDDSSFSHTYIKYYNNYSARWIILQASGLEVNIIGETAFNIKENIIKEFAIPISDAQKLKTVQFGIDNLGVPYGLKHIIGIVIVKFANLFGKRIANPFPEAGTMVCSELVAYALNEIILPTDTINFETATPTDVYNYLAARF